MDREGGRRGWGGRARMTLVAGVCVAVVALAGLAVQAVRGSRAAGVELSAATVRTAHLDDAFYRCIEVQAHSLVTPTEPVALDDPNFGDLITLLKGVGPWADIADPSSTAVALVSLQHRTGPGACMGTVVVARYRGALGVRGVRVGSGASVPGSKPPPIPGL